MTTQPLSLRHDLEQLAAWGVEHLNAILAIDSQSDERSESLPSSEGQRQLSAYLDAFFRRLGYQPQSDDFANLLVPIPSNLPPHTQAPVLALMSHLDTSHGTKTIDALLEMPRWDGRPIAYPANPRLHVTPEEYPQIKRFLGEDLLHGRGDAPVGLDNKLGMAQLMTLARLLAEEPHIPHGTIWLIFRPDEEIGRMRAVEGLAGHLVTLGVDVGYTIDGLDPFEINVENFQASRALFSFQGQPLALPSASHAKCLHLTLLGVKSHGATAKAEGYRNATRLLWEILALCPDAPIVPLRFQSAEDAEVNAQIQLLLYGQDQAALQATEEQLSRALEMTFSPLRRRGAIWTLNESTEVDLAQPLTDEMVQVFALLKQFFTMTASPSPLLSEESEGFQGYTNPYFIEQGEGRASLAFRIRDFDPKELRAREQALEKLHADHPHATLKIDQQYINMGSALAPYPQLIEWAKAAAAQIGVEAPRQPIRGGTGVDPFLQHGIPIANLGTGYFAPESEKEFTSRQCLAKHILWLTHLVAHITHLH